jgi:hypothetical protein
MSLPTAADPGAGVRDALATGAPAIEIAVAARVRVSAAEMVASQPGRAVTGSSARRSPGFDFRAVTVSPNFSREAVTLCPSRKFRKDGPGWARLARQIEWPLKV